MRGFDFFKKELDDAKEEGISVPPKVEEAVEEYQRQAEEVERLCLEQEARERQADSNQEQPVKQR